MPNLYEFREVVNEIPERLSKPTLNFELFPNGADWKVTGSLYWNSHSSEYFPSLSFGLVSKGKHCYFSIDSLQFIDTDYHEAILCFQEYLIGKADKLNEAFNEK